MTRAGDVTMVNSLDTQALTSDVMMSSSDSVASDSSSTIAGSASSAPIGGRDTSTAPSFSSFLPNPRREPPSATWRTAPLQQSQAGRVKSVQRGKRVRIRWSDRAGTVAGDVITTPWGSMKEEKMMGSRRASASAAFDVMVRRHLSKLLTFFCVIRC